MSAGPEISAVIVAWNAGDELVEAIHALRDSARNGAVRLEVVLVGNGPAPIASGVRELADVVVENPVNAGFAVAADQGLALASAPWALLVNPDLRVLPGTLGELRNAALAAAAQVASIVPELRFADDPGVVNSRGVQLDRLGLPAERDVGSPAGTAAAGPVFGGSGGGWMVRRSALLRAGALEPVYFAYLEDLDLSARLQRAGMGALLWPRAAALHAGSTSTGHGSPLKLYLVARNRHVLFALQRPAPWAVPVRVALDLGHMVVQMALSRRGEPLTGRLAARRGRRHVRFLRSSDRALGLAPRLPEASLAPPPTPLATLRRKLVAGRFMREASRTP